jgi:hypothetical protein
MPYEHTWNFLASGNRASPRARPGKQVGDWFMTVAEAAAERQRRHRARSEHQIYIPADDWFQALRAGSRLTNALATTGKVDLVRRPGRY